MIEKVFLKARCRYLLQSRTCAPQVIKIRHPCKTTDHVLVPTDAFSWFCLAPMDHPIEINAKGFDIRRMSPDLLGRHRDSRILKKARFAAPLHYGGCIYTFQRPQKGTPRKSLADNRGMDLGSESLLTMLCSEMIHEDVPFLPHTNAPAPESSLKIGIVLHLHYPELWPEFATFLQHAKLDFRLIVTLTTQNAALISRIRSSYPDARILVDDNVGRDIRPFIKVLQSAHLQGLDVICKIHAKRSVFSGVPDARFGHLWRRRALLDLLGSPLQVQKTLDRFETSPDLGMLGPATLRLKNGSGIDPGHKDSLLARRHLSELCGFDPSYINENYFAGTMFWVRTTALAALQDVTLPEDAFTEESMQTGEQFEHAVERFFSDCVRAHGYTLGDIEPLVLAKPHIPIRSSEGRLLAPHALFEAPRAWYLSRWQRPFEQDLSNHRVALIAAHDVEAAGVQIRYLQRQGWLVCLCLSVSPKDLDMDVVASADAVFLRQYGGQEIDIWAAALRSDPPIWDAKTLSLRSMINSALLTLDRGPRSTEVRAQLENALVWNKPSETLFRSRDFFAKFSTQTTDN